MNLKDLSQVIPFEFREQSYSRYKEELTVVAYVNARDVMNLLDKVCGVQNWQRDHKNLTDSEGKAVTYCGIGINTGNDSWVWKWDSGDESQQSSTKGASSDSFKRASVNFGISRFLYALEKITVPANAKKWTKKEEVSNAKNGVYQDLHPVDQTGKKIYKLNEWIWQNRFDQILECLEGYQFSEEFEIFLRKINPQYGFFQDGIDSLNNSKNLDELKENFGNFWKQIHKQNYKEMLKSVYEALKQNFPDKKEEISKENTNVQEAKSLTQAQAPELSLEDLEKEKLAVNEVSSCESISEIQKVVEKYNGLKRRSQVYAKAIEKKVNFVAEKLFEEFKSKVHNCRNEKQITGVRMAYPSFDSYPEWKDKFDIIVKEKLSALPDIKAV